MHFLSLWCHEQPYDVSATSLIVGVIIRKKIPTLSTGFNKREHLSNKEAFHQHPSSCQVNGLALSLFGALLGHPAEQ